VRPSLVQVTKFLEKPKVEETDSSKACPPLYIYSKAALPLINQYVDEADGKLALIDAPGSLGTHALLYPCLCERIMLTRRTRPTWMT
jgi:UTP-glucose-1-phosphate uridylyltransferase